jgi:signal-transduction protein with cAMP-binding, CBS, and nucleotidyltransferase domain
METVATTTLIDTLGMPYFRELSTFGALSDQVIKEILERGTITSIAKGEYIDRIGQPVNEFQVVLQGKIAYYKHFEGHDVLTRYFSKGEQMGFDQMIGLIPYAGTDVAAQDSLILDVSHTQFYDLHENYPEDFGLLMINLARELSREITMLEDVIGDSVGWIQES